MKHRLIWKVLPMSVLCFFSISKWWFVKAVDGPGDVVAYGFPMIYRAPGFHTSLSYQFFLIEMVVDFIIYFLLISLIYLVLKSLIKVQTPKWIFVIIRVCAVILILFNVIVYGFILPDNKFLIKRDFEIEVHKSGINWFWEEQHVVEFQKNGT